MRGVGNIIIGVDRETLINQLVINKFIWKNEHPKSKKALSTLSAYDIIQYYNNVIRSFIHYYGPCIHKKSYLEYTIHLLAYSCYHTLSQKFRCSISALLKKYGNSIKYQETKNGKTKRIELIYKNTSFEFEKTNIRRKYILETLYQNPKDIDYILRNKTIKDPFSF